MSKKTVNNPGAEQDVDLGEVYSRTELFVEKNRKNIFIAAGALVVLVGGFLGYKKLIAEPRAAAAAEQIWKAEYWFEVDSLDLAINGNDMYPGFAEVASQYGSTPSGKLAHYYLGAIHMLRGEYDDAIANYKKADVDDDVLRAMAVGGIGDAYVELGNTAEAARQFEKAADLVRNDFTTPMYLMKAGILHHQAKDWKAAAKAFNRIVKDFPTSNEVSNARKYAGLAEGMSGK